VSVGTQNDIEKLRPTWAELSTGEGVGEGVFTAVKADPTAWIPVGVLVLELTALSTAAEAVETADWLTTAVLERCSCSQALYSA